MRLDETKEAHTRGACSEDARRKVLRAEEAGAGARKDREASRESTIDADIIEDDG